MRLSIIVPVYNVAPFLRKCVDSLFAQGLSQEDYEIILVDDGSPDDCPGICDEYAANHVNVKVVHRSNGGLSAARNSGFEVAQGAYVQFVDSDDYLESNVLEGLVLKMENEELDVLRFNYQNVNEQFKPFEPNKVRKPFVDYKDEVCDGLSFLTERLGSGCYAWQFMIRRSILNNCLFKEGLLFEDVEWTPRMLVKAERVTSTKLIVYNYLMRPGSITQDSNPEKKRKAMEDKFVLINSLHTQMSGVYDNRWFKGMIAQITIGIIADIGKFFFEDKDVYIDRIKAMKVLPLCPFHSTKQAERKISIANISPMLLCWLLHSSSR